MNANEILVKIAQQAFDDELQKIALVGKLKLPHAIKKRIATSPDVDHRTLKGALFNEFGIVPHLKRELRDTRDVASRMSARIKANPELNSSMEFARSLSKNRFV